MQGKIALEEHILTPELVEYLLPVVKKSEIWRSSLERALERGEKRIAEMDRAGIERAVLSLPASGVQGEPDPERARDLARKFNDDLAATIQHYPSRFSGFAAVPLQDPRYAVDELERGVEELGLSGVLVNGYTRGFGATEGLYYDDPRFFEFWERLEELQVPMYLHPTFPLQDQRRVYEGYPYLLAAPWGFAIETASHAVRLIASGLLDRFPGLSIILGHLGEFLPFAVHRMTERMRFVETKLQKTMVEYLNENFYITTSGNCHTPSLIACLLQVGAERILYATDYPYESMAESSSWFDSVPISERDRKKIGRENAQKLLSL